MSTKRRIYKNDSPELKLEAVKRGDILGLTSGQ
jgi:hypothetical protein